MCSLNFLLILFISWLFCLTTLQKTEALPLTKNRTDNVNPKMINTITVDTPKTGMGMRLFPVEMKHREIAGVHVDSKLTSKQIQLFAQGADPSAGPGVNGTTEKILPRFDFLPGNEELTISVPMYRKDSKGNWVYHVWHSTRNNIWRDTRFHNRGGFQTLPRISVDPDAPRRYYPSRFRSTVCADKSTIYNVPIVKRWLKRAIYVSRYRSRPIYTDLREQLFEQGESEICHNKDAVKFVPYMECAIRRNQRMEYMIPKYPLHQLGYRFRHTRPD